MIGREIAAIGVPQEVARLLAAAILGAVIGFEREHGERAAGLRTHALVCVASALVMIVSAYGFADAVTLRAPSCSTPRAWPPRWSVVWASWAPGPLFYARTRCRG